MKNAVSFCGTTGKAWSFEHANKNGQWAAMPGVAIFAAEDTYGWRVIKVVELTGRRHDVRPIWALADAERYGATDVFVSIQMDRHMRLAIAEDIEMGLSPVVHTTFGGLAMAA